MNLIVFGLIVHTLSAFPDSSYSGDSTPKQKQILLDQISLYHIEDKPLLLYDDNTATATRLSGLYAPVEIKPVFGEGSASDKQVAAQQVLYEYQQTPTNAVSNVHVNQYYQPLPQRQENNNNYAVSRPEQQSSQQSFAANNGPNQFPIISSETVASPVQHSSLIRHGQNFAQVQFQPLGAYVPQHIQTQQYVPGKYLYVNGKINYQPSHNPSIGYHVPQTQQMPPLLQNTHPLTFQHAQNRQLNFANRPQLAQRLMPPPQTSTLKNFHPPQRHQMQQITKPVTSKPVQENQNEESEEESAQEKDHDDVEEGDDKGEYEEVRDGDDDDHFERYSSFDDHDDDDHEGYKMQEDGDDDSEEGSSRYSSKKHHPKKKPKSQNRKKSGSYKFYENFDSSYEKPARPDKKNGKSHMMQYKSVKYTKNGNGKPKIERLESRQSENIPVVHKQKVFKEKWYVTKSSNGSTSL